MSLLRSVLRPALTARHMSSAASRFDRTAKLADESVLEHLVCPISKFPIRYDAERGSLVCDEINVEYPIYKGVPMLVPSEGRIISDQQ
ncbi:Protein preY, mitochondrial [Phytophthora megakarya]|uniref:Protein preY, mitochondrial n=1 Tax=Phytophthora megakarya TaxID=4795 RepID=A0A225WTH3_9STRA|nr:Protein preY, mitochondrial [Phytophthora megakarya]